MKIQFIDLFSPLFLIARKDVSQTGLRDQVEEVEQAPAGTLGKMAVKGVSTRKGARLTREVPGRPDWASGTRNA